MDWICSWGILPSPKDQSVLLREAILGAVDKLIFVYNLSQTIQMIGWFFISLCIQGNMKNWGLGIFAGSVRRLTGPLSALGHAPHQQLQSEEWWEYYARLFPVTPHPPLPPSSFSPLTILIHMATRWRERGSEQSKMRDKAIGWPPLWLAVFDFCCLSIIHDWQSYWHSSLGPLALLYCPPTLNQPPSTTASSTIETVSSFSGPQLSCCYKHFLLG